MERVVIEADGLSKQFMIPHERTLRADTLRDEIAGFLGRLGTRSGNHRPEPFQALDQLSFSIHQGERVGIIGKNGSGKSTLLKIISRITPPSSGSLSIDGRVASLLEVGTGFHHELSGRENIFLNGSILGMSRREIRARFDEIVAFSGVEKFLDTPVKKYSSGMYVRLAFSVAAHMDPEILLVDEVLALGDQEFQVRCLAKLDELSKGEGRTVLFVSHNLDAIRVLCARCLLLESGKLVSDGPVQRVIETYLDRSFQKLHAQYEPVPAQASIVSVQLNADALKRGAFELDIEYHSDIFLDPPVPGFVIYNAMNVPVLGSNPRYHQGDSLRPGIGRGKARALIPMLPLHTGLYKVDVWLGNREGDFDHKHDALVFEYQGRMPYLAKPDPLAIGAVDLPCQWTSMETSSNES